MSEKLKLTGYKFRGGVVLKDTDKRECGSVVYLCKCNNCNKEDWELSARRIKHDNPISCGCLDNKAIATIKHGMTNSRFYNIWDNMKRRVRNKDGRWSHLYVGKNIKVSKNWEDNFENFKEDMYDSYLIACNRWGENRVSLDRKNSNKGYSRENCRWANPVTQSYNQNYLNHSKTKFILATRIEDGYKIITANANMFSRRIFDTANNHIHAVCSGIRSKEKGWKFEYIKKEKYLELKNNNFDFIENIENFKINTHYYYVDIETSSRNTKDRQRYLNSIRQYYINIGNNIFYGTHKEVYKVLGFNTVNGFKGHLSKAKTKKVRKLTPTEIEIYLSKEVHGIKFDSPIN